VSDYPPPGDDRLNWLAFEDRRWMRCPDGPRRIGDGLHRETSACLRIGCMPVHVVEWDAGPFDHPSAIGWPDG
jgi:hypothetical protein